MPEPQANPSTPPTGKVRDGFSAPIEDPGEGKVPEHIHPDTLMAKGVDPETKETVTVNLAVLQKKHGEKKGRALYDRVARLGGFFNPNEEPQGSNFAPDLQLEGVDKKLRGELDAILNEA